MFKDKDPWNLDWRALALLVVAIIIVFVAAGVIMASTVSPWWAWVLLVVSVALLVIAIAWCTREKADLEEAEDKALDREAER